MWECFNGEGVTAYLSKLVGVTRRKRTVQVRDRRVLASVGDRVWAALIDGVFLSLAGALLFPVAAMAGLGDDETSVVTALFAWLVLSSIYEVGCTAVSGQTLGKKLVGIKVVGLDGERPGWARAIKRTAVGIVAGFLPGPAGEVAPPLVQARVLWDKERQGYHDLFAGTYVVRSEAVSRVCRSRRR